MITVTKSYKDFPAAHRQPKHEGHCRLVHGHNWGWDIVFACERLDDCGFVLDIGRLGLVKDFLTHNFDHTTLINLDDPDRNIFTEDLDHYDVVLVPNCGMEGLAKFVFEEVQTILNEHFVDDVRKRGLRVFEVTCWEDSKNRATIRI